MAQEIYNEGRVVGLSAWEIYVKNALSNGVLPEDIPDERQWLAQMLGNGASMILKIPAGTTQGVHDYTLPTGSELSAAGTIIANPFMGTCTMDIDTDTWATKVESYGGLLQNTYDSSPSDDGATVPYDENYNNLAYGNIVADFVKITDGIVYTKNAHWYQTGDIPQKDIDPNFNESTTVIRLYIDSTINNDVYVLFTGFTNKRILQTLSGWAHVEGGLSAYGSTDVLHNDWANGGMVGPEIIPWASKIIFMVPNSAYNLSNSLTRTIPSDDVLSDNYNIDGITFRHLNDYTVKSNAFIDLDSITLTDYYNQHTYNPSPMLAESISSLALGINDSYSNLVAWYPGMTAAAIKAEAQAATPSNANFFPPALYAAQITSNGTKSLVPLDTAAPGTVKGFSDATQAYNYKQLMPYNFSFYQNPVTNSVSFVTYGESDPTKWPGTAKLEYIDTTYPMAKLTVGEDITKVISLTTAAGADYSLVGANGVETAEFGPTNYLSWASMLKALKAGKKMNVLGERLKAVGTELESTNTIGVDATNDHITEVGADTVTLHPGVSGSEVSVTSAAGDNGTVAYAQMDANTTLQVGTNFIKFGTGNDAIKLYISKTNPGTANVPEGSIGIGWD